MNHFCLLLICWVVSSQLIFSQNTLSNHSFDDAISPPTQIDQFENTLAWEKLMKTPDLMNESTLNSHPWSFQANNGANTGIGYVGLYASGGGAGVAEAIGQDLDNRPLEAGKTYQFEFYAKRSITSFLQSCNSRVELYGFDSPVAYNPVDAHLSTYTNATFLWASENIINETWAFYSGTFVAPATISYFVISGPLCSTGSTYFYLDDARLQENSAVNPPIATTGCGEASFQTRIAQTGENIFNPQVIKASNSFVGSFYNVNFSTNDVSTLVKFEEDGTVDWMKSYDYGERWRTGDLIETIDGGIITISSSNNTCDLQKTNEEGEWLWAKRYRTNLPQTNGRSLIAHPDGSITIGGSTQNAFFEAASGVLIKVDANGNLIWDSRITANPNANGDDGFVIGDLSYWHLMVVSLSLGNHWIYL